MPTTPPAPRPQPAPSRRAPRSTTRPAPPSGWAASTRAAALHRKALRVRDDADSGGLQLGPREDAAATRDNLAQVYETRGDMARAREVRLKGADRGATMCGSCDCVKPGGAMLSRQDLKACGSCKSVFYCSATCQRRDWIKRHKPLCKAHAAAAASTAAAS